MAIIFCSVVCWGACNRILVTEVWKQNSFICGSHSIKWLQIQHRNSDVYICTIYSMLRKIFNLSYKMSIFLAHLVMTIYINYHFAWVTKWNLNIIKEHVTSKQHLRNIVIELLHWKSCTHIKSTEVSQAHCFERIQSISI